MEHDACRLNEYMYEVIIIKHYIIQRVYKVFLKIMTSFVIRFPRQLFRLHEVQGLRPRGGLVPGSLLRGLQVRQAGVRQAGGGGNGLRARGRPQGQPRLLPRQGRRRPQGRVPRLLSGLRLRGGN